MPRLAVLALLATWVVYLDLVRAAWPFVTDDAHITLRYAENVAAGFGPAWNRSDGPVVEGFSSPAYVALAAAAIRCGIDPLTVLRLCAVFGFLGASAVLFAIVRRRTGPALAAVPALLLLTFPGTAWWAVSGLETGAFVFVVVATYAAFLRARGRRRRTWLAAAGLGVGVGSLLRPDGPILGAALAVALVVTWVRRLRAAPRALRRHLGAAAAGDALALAAGFCVVFGPLLAWRWSTFGAWIPNSVACKAAGGGAFGRVVLEGLPLLAGSVALGWPLRRAWLAPVHLVPLATAVLYVLALLDASPSVAYLGRHVLAAYALVAVPAAAGLGRWLARGPDPAKDPWLAVLAVEVFAFALLSAGGVRGLLSEHARAYARRQAARGEVAAFLREHLPRGATYVVGDVGLMGHETPFLGILDAYCLNSRETTTPPVSFSQARFADLVLRRRPEAIVISSRRADRLVPRSGVYRRLLADPRFDARYARAAVFGASGDTFHYFVYLRTDPPVSLRRGAATDRRA